MNFNEIRHFINLTEYFSHKKPVDIYWNMRFNGHIFLKNLTMKEATNGISDDYLAFRGED